MLSRLSAFVVWALVAGAAMFWALRLMASPLQAPPQTTAVSTELAARGDLQRLLGAPVAEAPAPVPEATGRFRLIGVVAPHRPAQAGSGVGIALLTVDDKPPRPYRVGATVDGDWRVQEVSTRAVVLAGPATAAPVRLELPPLAAAATGQLPVVSLSSAAPQPPGGAARPPGPAFMPPPAVAPAPAPAGPTPAPSPAAPLASPSGEQPMANPGAPPPTLYQPPGAVMPSSAR